MRYKFGEEVSEFVQFQWPHSSGKNPQVFFWIRFGFRLGLFKFIVLIILLGQGLEGRTVLEGAPLCGDRCAARCAASCAARGTARSAEPSSCGAVPSPAEDESASDAGRAAMPARLREKLLSDHGMWMTSPLILMCILLILTDRHVLL